jgi:hypothetical protein
MAISGDISSFKELFPDHLITEILETIFAAWSKTPKRLEIENRVTRRLDVFLRQEKDERDLPLRVSIQHSLTDPVTFQESARIDLVLTPVGSNKDRVYFAFECKRLRIPYKKGKLSSGTSDYIGKAGMGCFLTGQYSSGLPHAGMLGYVMDGNWASAEKSIETNIAKHAAKLGLKGSSSWIASTWLAHKQAKQTSHLVVKNLVTIHHLLLPL